MIKLKHLVENSTEVAYSPLTKEEKKKLYETIKAYNEYRGALKAESVYETAMFRSVPRCCRNSQENALQPGCRAGCLHFS